MAEAGIAVLRGEAMKKPNGYRFKKNKKGNKNKSRNKKKPWRIRKKKWLIRKKKRK